MLTGWLAGLLAAASKMKKAVRPLLLLLLTAVAVAASPACPTTFEYVKTIGWDSSTCAKNLANSDCCQSLLSLFGVAIAQHLRNTSQFQFPDVGSAQACLSDFRDAVSASFPSLSAASTLVPQCLSNASEFVSSRQNCAAMETVADWRDRLGNNTAVDRQCVGDLSGLSACNLCKDAGQTVTAQLAALSNTSYNETNIALNCFYFACLYAGAIVNKLGPAVPGTASCTFGLAIVSARKKSSSSAAGRTSAAFAAVGVLVLLVVAALLVLWLRRRRRRKAAHREFERRSRETVEAAVASGRRPNTGAIWFKWKDIQAATCKFSNKNLIGTGAFGAVYRGTFPDGRQIAVKRILDTAGGSGDADFANEVEIINSIRHRNLVALRGCCVASDDGAGPQRLLIYDYFWRGSLADHLFTERGRRSPLTWGQRRRIIVGTARALAYLHSGVRPAIFHRDVKPTNILLDDDFNALVTDFGLARIVQQRGDAGGGSSMALADDFSVTTRVAGTHGYLAPEYALYGQLSDKSDVYSFGVVLLETLSGRPALAADAAEACDYLITDWAWRLLKAGKGVQVLDPTIGEDGCESMMLRFVSVGVLCAHVMVAFRPSMSEALKILQGDIDVPDIPDRPLPLAVPARCAFLPHLFTSASGRSVSSSSTATGPTPFFPNSGLLR